VSAGRYAVAFLAGHGIGPEVTAEASRAIDAVSGLHGFLVDEHHVLFGTDALMRFGHPYPTTSRRAVLGSDAVLVGPGGEPLDALEAELDVRASVTRIRFDDHRELSLLSPAEEGSWSWTLARAVGLAGESRARVTLVGVGDTWAAEATGAARDGLEVERLRTSDAMRALVFSPERFDVVVFPPELGLAASELAACASQRRVAAWGRLADTGPSLFGGGLDPQHDVAGHGVADPMPMLLAAALMLGEGLGERAAAATLSSALGRTPFPASTPSTRGLADAVLAELPHGLGVEFLQEAV
jgi:isocitrate/isopropylmalate dehydrogenase